MGRVALAVVLAPESPLATDGSSLPLNIVLSLGQAHESQYAPRLPDSIGVQRQNGNMKRRGHTVLNSCA